MDQSIEHAIAVIEALSPAHKADSGHRFIWSYPDIEPFRKQCLNFQQVGSRITCDPPPTDTDDDYIALVKDARHASSQLADLGIYSTPNDPMGVYAAGEAIFVSYRHGNLNLLVTQDGEFFRHFLCATSLSTRLNLMQKEDRIALFQAVLYRETYTGRIEFCATCEGSGWIESSFQAAHGPNFDVCPKCYNPRGSRHP